MRALCWNGVNDLRAETVADPKILDPRDVIVRVTLSSVCGSDLHYIHGFLPGMIAGDVLGHEFMGEVVETGRDVKGVTVGDRVVVPSIVSCGDCDFCTEGQWAMCDRTNPNSALEEPVLGYPTAAFYGCSHLLGGLPGSHAQFIRVPHGEKGCFKIPAGVSDEQALFLSDAAPTAYMAAELTQIKPGDTVAVWGCGAVGLLAQQFARQLGAGRVIAIDGVPERLKIARERLGSETIDFVGEGDVLRRLKEMTAGRGPERCIDAVGLEARGTGIGGVYDHVKQSLHLATDRGEALRQALRCCRKGGTVTVMGIYFVMDKFPLGTIISKILKIRAGLQNGHAYIPKLLEMTQAGKLDASFLATHRYSLEEGRKAYDVFKHKEDGCLRAVFAPN